VLWADGPNPALMAIPASFFCSAVFLTLAIVTGGLWYVRRARGEAARAPRRTFFSAVAGAVVFGGVGGVLIGLLEYDAWKRDGALVGRWQEVEGPRLVEFGRDNRVTITEGEHTAPLGRWSLHADRTRFRIQLDAAPNAWHTLTPKPREMQIPVGDEKPATFRKID
jgi:hypothetical protein